MNAALEKTYRLRMPKTNVAPKRDTTMVTPAIYLQPNSSRCGGAKLTATIQNTHRMNRTIRI